MTIGNDGNAPPRQPEATFNAREHLPRRSRTMPILIGIVVLLLIGTGVYLYADRDSDITGNNEPKQTAENTPAPAAQPPTPSPSAQPPSGAQPPATPAPAAPERSAAQPAPNQIAQTPPPAEPQPAQPQPMQQQSTNLPEDANMMAVRVASANLRAAPSLRARVVVTTHKGDKMKVLSRSGKWVQVEADGRKGWINGKMLGPQ